ncbi:hypothetical protein [Vibrio mediterranei]|uniref:hypothetical protein n=1 Tax=Vibrio mediterranei TaxID=689 RepID=UPI00148D0C03|nr:hypothetical protein [Vibrio mediterranei]NOI26185.1 hypothetical protein [Vibrio mediterranei]
MKTRMIRATLFTLALAMTGCKSLEGAYPEVITSAEGNAELNDRAFQAKAVDITLDKVIELSNYDSGYSLAVDDWSTAAEIKWSNQVNHVATLIHSQTSDDFLFEVPITLTREMYSPDEKRFCVELSSNWLKEHNLWDHDRIELMSSRTQLQHHVSRDFSFARISSPLIKTAVKSKTEEGVSQYEVASALHSSGYKKGYRNGQIVNLIDRDTTVGTCIYVEDREEAKTLLGTKFTYVFRPTLAINANGVYVVTVPRKSVSFYMEKPNGQFKANRATEHKYTPITRFAWAYMNNVDFQRIVYGRLTTDEEHQQL